jgi:hypothetical protein
MAVSSKTSNTRSSLRRIAKGKTVGGKVEKRIQGSARNTRQSRRLPGEKKKGMELPRRESTRSMKSKHHVGSKTEKE